MKVIDLTTKTQALQVRLDPSPVYDLLAAMYLVENWTPDRGFEIDRRWVARARKALDPAMRRDLHLFGQERGFLMGLTGLIEDRSGISVDEFLDVLRATAPVEVLTRMLTAPRAARPAAAVIREALAEPSGAAVEAAVAAYPSDFDAARVRAIIAQGPRAAQARLIDLVGGFYDRVYRHEEAEVLPILRADVEAKQALAATMSPVDLVERASGGFQINPDSDVSDVVLAPTFHFRPYNLISEYPGVRVFIYPVDAAAADSGASARDLTRLFKALGDETRLRVLQLLGEREMYLQEIANGLGVTHVTAIHHLALLRAAHLVRVVERQGKNYYQLRPEITAEVTDRVMRLLGKQKTKAGQRH